MIKDKGFRYRWLIGVLVIASSIMIPLLNNQVSSAAISVTRTLPGTVSPGQNFEVLISFTASLDNFNAIGLSDFAPAGWMVVTDTALCDPKVFEGLATLNRADYLWAGPYPSKTNFTALYRVFVPTDATAGTYNFTNGSLKYYLAGTGPTITTIGGQSSVNVGLVNILPPVHSSSPTLTTTPSPIITLSTTTPWSEVSTTPTIDAPFRPDPQFTPNASGLPIVTTVTTPPSSTSPAPTGTSSIAGDSLTPASSHPRSPEPSSKSWLTWLIGGVVIVAAGATLIIFTKRKSHK